MQLGVMRAFLGLRWWQGFIVSVLLSSPVAGLRPAPAGPLRAGPLRAGHGGEEALGAYRAATCRQAVLAMADEYSSYDCFLRLRGDPEARAAALQELEALSEVRPGSGWPVLVLGHLTLVAGQRDRAMDFYGRAIECFSIAGEALGEVLARANRHMIFLRKGRFIAAVQEIEKARQAGYGSTDPETRARVFVLEASHALRTGGDLVSAFASLEAASEAAFPHGAYGLQRRILYLQSDLAFQLGHYDRALEAYRRLERLMRSRGDPTELARVAFNSVNVRQAQLEQEPEADGSKSLRGWVLEVLALAREFDDDLIVGRSFALLARLEAKGNPAAALARAGSCLEIARKVRRASLESTCLAARAFVEEGADPQAALATTALSLDVAASVGSTLLLAHGWRARMRAAWAALPPKEAIAEGLKGLDAIERLRDNQRDALDRASIVGSWISDYRWLAGRLLEISAEEVEYGYPVAAQPAVGQAAVGRSGSLAKAFAILERLRARVLLETVHIRTARDPEEQLALAEIRRKTSQLYRRLMDPVLLDEARRQDLAELERLEMEERLLGLEASPSTAPRSVPGRTEAAVTTVLETSVPATTVPVKRVPVLEVSAEDNVLWRVAAQLGPDEALLSFQLDDWEDLFGSPSGGSWVVAVTREGARAYRLPGRQHLEASTAILRGLIQRRDGSEAEAAAALGTQLLGSVLADLTDRSQALRRLVLVPDGGLHQLPFSALRMTPEGDPLGVLYELVVAPSATLWVEWRQAGVSQTETEVESARGVQGESDSPNSVLVLADPVLPPGRSSFAAAPAGIWGENFQPRALPEARREGRAIRRYLGARLLEGTAASERRFKDEALGSYAVIHFATHAVVDARRPERSSLLLAPGDGEEDGLLRGPEISDLNLGAGLVVLSACQTSDGPILPGEGLISLARAFFAAGSLAVIGSRWSLADHEAATFFDFFYRHLAGGETVAGSLRAARRSAWEAGLPAQAWAAPVLLGTGELRVPRSPEAAKPFATALAMALAMAQRGAPRFFALGLLALFAVGFFRRPGR